MDQGLIVSLINQLASDPSFLSRFQNYIATQNQPHRIVISNSTPNSETPNSISQQVQTPFVSPIQPVEQIIFTPQDLFDKVAPSRISDFCDEREKCSIIIDTALIVETVQKRFKKQAERVNKHKANVESTFKINQLVMVDKPPYAKAIKINDGEIRKRKAKVLSLTQGNKIVVEWQATGGFLSTETPFTQCKYPIDPKYLSSRVLGCDKDAANFDDEVFEEISQETNDVLPSESFQNTSNSLPAEEELSPSDEMSQETDSANNDVLPSESVPISSKKTTSSDGDDVIKVASISSTLESEEVIITPVRGRRSKRPSNRISPPFRKK
ncbi:predicted protein [Naegleria gruberi]|uniref:Predicted protein n=1 Tax=Naegleria gruberi TaxID=5762 RepID=D2V7N0_NAEGR|nr:uncharacterized protein NAEGRDRAFT_47327 [Naegleria gruberi]EFC47407.1 predicted protein [Naegleria gruberi]|eukprot:XP_002680151.1 predicted protein [Naegleria gruberi strain NEG-M]